MSNRSAWDLRVKQKKSNLWYVQFPKFSKIIFKSILIDEKSFNPTVYYLVRIGSFLNGTILVGPGDRVLSDACLFKLAASNIAARSGSELDRRRLFWNVALFIGACSFAPSSWSRAPSLRIPNCFLNHLLDKGLTGTLRFPSLSISFNDWILALQSGDPELSSFFPSFSGFNESFGGLFFFVSID